jgi:hypothetical protein
MQSEKVWDVVKPILTVSVKRSGSLALQFRSFEIVTEGKKKDDLEKFN